MVVRAQEGRQSPTVGGVGGQGGVISEQGWGLGKWYANCSGSPSLPRRPDPGEITQTCCWKGAGSCPFQ